jgi:hypothetical protein
MMMMDVKGPGIKRRCYIFQINILGLYLPKIYCFVRVDNADPMAEVEGIPVLVEVKRPMRWGSVYMAIFGCSQNELYVFPPFHPIDT